jgi:hypothetical protein
MSVQDTFNRLLQSDPNDLNETGPVSTTAPQAEVYDDSLSTRFRRGAQAGALGLASDLEYFGAIANTISGDDADAEANIRRADTLQAIGQSGTQDFETFEQFLDDPSIDGFFGQVAGFTGELLPSAISSITGAGIGAIAARTALSKSARTAAARIAKDAVERRAKRVAAGEVIDEAREGAEDRLARMIYDQARSNITKAGGATGAFASEYAPIAGGNFSEALGAGQERTKEEAFRAAIVATPQAALGVGGEAILLKNIAEVATKRAAKEGGVFSQLAKELGSAMGKGGTTEGLVELGQEAIGVANRMSYDEDYTAQEAQLRLGQAAFAGFIGGAAFGGVGTIPATAYRNRDKINESVGKIYDKATDMMDTMRSQQLNDQIDGEQYGDVLSGYTTPESEADINAQVGAMLDPQSAKKAVWAAGEEPRFAARKDTVTKVQSADGTVMYSAFIPGRGTILSQDKDLVTEVVKSRASDRALQIALGYSAPKSALADGDIVVQVLDKNGNVVSEELTDSTNLANAFSAAVALRPEGGTVNQITADQALETRRKRYEAEQNKTDGFSDMDIPQDVLDGLGYGEVDFDNIDATQLNEPIVIGDRTYKPITPELYETNAQARTSIDEARAEFNEEFGATDFTTGDLANANASVLRKAIDTKRENPTSEVFVERDTDGNHIVKLAQSNQDMDADVGTKILVDTIRKGRSQRAAGRSPFSVARTDSDALPIALPYKSLVIGGKQILRSQGTAETDISDSRALQAIAAELMLNGYDLNVNGQSFNKVTNPASLPDGMNVEVEPGKSLQDVLSGATKAGKEAKYSLITPEGTMAELGYTTAPSEAELNRQGYTYNPKKATRRADEATIPAFLEEDGVEVSMLPPEQEMPDTVYGVAADARTTPNTGPTRVEVERDYLGFVDPEFTAIVEDLVKAIRIKTDPVFLTSQNLLSMTDEELRALAENDTVYGYLRMTVDAFNANPNKRARVVYNGANPIIVVNNNLPDLERALAISHELGHLLYREQQQELLSDPQRVDALKKAFLTSRNGKLYLNNYTADKAFEEWFADQVATYAYDKRYDKRAEEVASAKRSKNSRLENMLRPFLNKLHAAFRRMNASLRRRFGAASPSFTVFMDEVIETRRAEKTESDAAPASQEPTATQQILATEVRREVERLVNNRYGSGGNGGNGGPNIGGNVYSNSSDIVVRRTRSLYDKVPMALQMVFFTADGILRRISPQIADMFYVESQASGRQGRLGMIRSTNLTMGKWKNRFEEEVGDINSQEVIDAMQVAYSDVATADLTGTPLKIRQFLDALYEEYVNESGVGIGRRENYFPVVLDLASIAANPEAFIDTLIANDPTLSRQEASRAVSKLVAYNNSTMDEDTVVDVTDPNGAVRKAIKLTKNIPRDQIQQFTVEPNQAFIKYTHSLIKRIEFEKATGGTEALRTQLDNLSPDQRATAERIISSYLGHTNKPLSPFMRQLNSWGQFVQIIGLLPFAAIASVPDLAGPIINGKEFGAFEMSLKAIRDTITDRAEAEALARQIGVVTSETVANAWVTEAEREFMDADVRKWSDKFFTYTGLDFFTKFSREFAANMGVQFLLHHADAPNARSDRYLQDLGVSSADIRAWNNNDRKFDTAEGKRVEAALQRFVESSIMRPNAAERPVWASDPRFALIWQLKSFMYSFSKTIMGGIKRERRERVREAQGGTFTEQFDAATGIVLMSGLALLPLAMLGLELREWAKFGLSSVLPGVDASDKYFRSDRMDWGPYLGEIISRAGIYGPMEMLFMAQRSAQWGNSGVATLLGPSVELVEKAIRNGWRVDKTVSERLPLYGWI